MNSSEFTRNGFTSLGYRNVGIKEGELEDGEGWRVKPRLIKAASSRRTPKSMNTESEPVLKREGGLASMTITSTSTSTNSG